MYFCFSPPAHLIFNVNVALLLQHKRKYFYTEKRSLFTHLYSLNPLHSSDLRWAKILDKHKTFTCTVTRLTCLTHSLSHSLFLSLSLRALVRKLTSPLHTEKKPISYLHHADRLASCFLRSHCHWVHSNSLVSLVYIH